MCDTRGSILSTLDQIQRMSQVICTQANYPHIRVTTGK